MEEVRRRKETRFKYRTHRSRHKAPMFILLLLVDGCKRAMVVCVQFSIRIIDHAMDRGTWPHVTVHSAPLSFSSLFFSFPPTTVTFLSFSPVGLLCSPYWQMGTSTGFLYLVVVFFSHFLTQFPLKGREEVLKKQQQQQNEEVAIEHVHCCCNRCFAPPPTRLTTDWM